MKIDFPKQKGYTIPCLLDPFPTQSEFWTQSKTIWKTNQTTKCEGDRKIVITAKLASEATILKYEKCSKNLNL